MYGGHVFVWTTTQNYFKMVGRKKKRAAGLASTYRNDTGANAELTTG